GKGHIIGLEQSHVESRVKRFARWLANDTLSFETYYMPFAREVARALAERGPLVVVFDGSAMGRGCITLMASVVYRKRALPLLWTVKRGKKGAFSTEEHVALLNQLRQIVPEEAEVIFLGDGEFDALALQRALSEARWSYVCRTSAATRITDGFTDCALGEINPWAGERYVSLPRASVTKAGYGPVHVIVWHEAPHREPILLVTNLELAEEALHFYGRRARIEIVFTQMTKREFLPLGTGGNHVPDLHLAVVEDDAVNQQFYQLSALSKVQLLEGRTDTLAKGLHAPGELRDIELLLSLRLQLALLLPEPVLRLIQLRSFPFEFLPRDDLRQKD